MSSNVLLLCQKFPALIAHVHTQTDAVSRCNIPRIRSLFHKQTLGLFSLYISTYLIFPIFLLFTQLTTTLCKLPTFFWLVFISGTKRISPAHQTSVSEQEREGGQDDNVHKRERGGGGEASGTFGLFGTAREVGWEIKFFLCGVQVKSIFFFCGVCKVCFFLLWWACGNCWMRWSDSWSQCYQPQTHSNTGPGSEGRRGDNKDWDGVDGGPRVIRNGMGPVRRMEFDLDTKLNQYKWRNTIRQINVEFRKDKGEIWPGFKAMTELWVSKFLQL